jgi:hypothetical protein
VKSSTRRRKELKKFMILGALVAMVMAALALPALAQQDGQNHLGDRFDRWNQQAEERDLSGEDYYDFLLQKVDNFYGAQDERNDRWNDENYNRWDDDRDWWNDDRHDDDRNNNNDDSVITQESNQTARSGDVSQSFNVNGGGDNSNQCVGLQGVSNTGNAQNQVSVLQYGSEADEFSFEDSGASINVSPTNMTSCNQQVNQAATASHGR